MKWFAPGQRDLLECIQISYIRFLSLSPPTRCSTSEVPGELLSLLWGVSSLRGTASCHVLEWTGPIKAVFRACLGFGMFLYLQEPYMMLPNRPFFLISFKSSPKPILTATRYSQWISQMSQSYQILHRISCCCTRGGRDWEYSTVEAKEPASMFGETVIPIPTV